MNKVLLSIIYTFLGLSLSAQFVSESGDTLYGNEWIDYEKDYYKISIGEDGIYRISYDELSIAGIPVGQIDGSNFQLMHNGTAYPIYVSNSGSLGSDDFIEFYGRKNRGELDRVFYEDPDNGQLNPEYSLFTDTSAYFLTWNTGSGNLRVNEVVTPSSGSELPLVEYYMHKERVVFNIRNHKPTRNGGDNVRYSHFDIGEGFGGPLQKKNEFLFNASDVYEEGPSPSIDIRFTTNATAHKIDFLLNNDKKAYFEHFGYALRQEKIEFQLEELKASNKITLEGTVDQFDRNIMSIVDLNYPREFRFDNQSYFEFYVEGGFEQKFVEVERFDGGDFPVIYDPGSGTRILPHVQDGKYQFVIPGSAEGRFLVAYNSEKEVDEISVLEKMDFVDFSSLGGEFIIISHPRLMSESSNAVEEYATYRRSAAGGSFNTIVVNVEDLYEQFSYGVHRHSYSVKNFVNWAAKNWENTKYVFILGKAREYGVYRTKEQIENLVHSNFAVPTFGMPGSDNYLASNGRVSTAHVIPTGRIAAKDEGDVRLYLEKVKEHEGFDNRPQTIEEKLWKKRIMHLAGAETSLQESIGTYLETMEETIENSQYGASVITFKKSSTETIQEADADELIDAIDAGLSVLTFFGHSDVGTFDFNIDDVKKLKNFGKYPLVISLGCFSGNVHTSSYGISEQYVLTESRGAIAFMASSSTAYVSPQGRFGEDYYEMLGGDLYGQSLGKIFQSTLEANDDKTSIHSKILNEQMTLHGDPSIKLARAEGPDYVFDYSSFITDPSIIESNQTEFDVNFKIVNLGSFVEDSLSVKVEHVKSNGELGAALEFMISAPKFDTLISRTFVNEDNGNVGKNIIRGELDFENKIVEIPDPAAEDNNKIESPNGDEGFVFFSINNSAVPVSPCDFGIYNEEEVALKASTYNALANRETNYVFELDTSGVFDSPLKQRFEVRSIGGLLEWKPELQFEHGKTYYWRISPDSLSADFGYKWEDASFVYLPNSSNGWNQSHYYQFLDNDFDGIYVDPESRDFEFDEQSVNLTLHNKFASGDVQPGIQYNFGNIALSIRPWSYLNSGVGFYIVDEEVFTDNGVGWINSDGKYGSVDGPFPADYRCFAYKTDTPEERKKIVDFVNNIVPEGAYVFFFTVVKNFSSDLNIEDWEGDSNVYGTNIFETFSSYGANLIGELKNVGTVPYSFIFQKGREVLGEDIGAAKDSYVKLSAFVSGKGNNGFMQSETIGPAKTWDKIILNSQVDSNLDSLTVEVFGIRENDSLELLKVVNFESEIDIKDINAGEFPRLKIKYYSKDSDKNTTSQLNFWRVLYEGFPDFGLNTSEDFVFNRDTLQQGEDLELSFRIDNTSEYVVDSVLVSVVLTDESNTEIITEDKVAFADTKQVSFSYKYNTSSLLGKYKISINVNGDGRTIEKNESNNFGVREFLVIKDVRNPVLDVSFDGNKILDGDIISPNPLIRINLKDENKFLLLDDPSIIEMALLYPDNMEEEILLGDDRVVFTPATDLTKNEALVEFTPDLITDGTYVLKVRAKDRSDNTSGALDFERSFEVINKQMISNVLNYPNPFSSSTQFVFTLTGSEIPEEIKIQVLTVSGKVVKEIFKEELGDLKIGINRTSYRYDGTDDFGNKLANGVYLYRVITKGDSGDQVDRLDRGTDQFFKNQLGKLVILR